MFKTLTWDKVVRKLTKFEIPLRGFHPLPGGTPLPSAGARKGNSPFHSVFPFRASRVRAGGSSRVRFAAPVGRALDEIRKLRMCEGSWQTRQINDCFYFVSIFNLRLLESGIMDSLRLGKNKVRRDGEYNYSRRVFEAYKDSSFQDSRNPKGNLL